MRPTRKYFLLFPRELEKTQEQLLATTETAELARREDARARRLATAREVGGIRWLLTRRVVLVGGSAAVLGIGLANRKPTPTRARDPISTVYTFFLPLRVGLEGGTQDFSTGKANGTMNRGRLLCHDAVQGRTGPNFVSTRRVTWPLLPCCMAWVSGDGRYALPDGPFRFFPQFRSLPCQRSVLFVGAG